MRRWHGFRIQPCRCGRNERQPLAALLGALQALDEEGAKLEGEQYGGYAQSSGSGNANVVVWRQ